MNRVSFIFYLVIQTREVPVSLSEDILSFYAFGKHLLRFVKWIFTTSRAFLETSFTFMFHFQAFLLAIRQIAQRGLFALCAEVLHKKFYCTTDVPSSDSLNLSMSQSNNLNKTKCSV